MCVVSLTTLLMLKGQCRHITLTKIPAMSDFETYILGLSREAPRACH